MRNRTNNLGPIALPIILLLCPASDIDAGERKDALLAALKGADRIEVRSSGLDRQDDPKKPFTCTDAAKIAELISSLDFDDDKSGFHCMCFGDAIIIFFKGRKKLALLSHHHGRSLRWYDGTWKGDSLFTAGAARAWRKWFEAQGEPRFEKMHQWALAEARREQEIHERFMRAFKTEAGIIFEAAAQDGMIAFAPGDTSEGNAEELSPSAEKLISLYPDRVDLGLALARALGALAEIGAIEGSWSVSSAR